MFHLPNSTGGGLEYGEGLLDALIREYQEECDFDIAVVKHIYTTDFMRNQL
jgi:ADP-ribose pyrophosphatase YjhB (NUDIX family)